MSEERIHNLGNLGSFGYDTFDKNTECFLQFPVVDNGQQFGFGKDCKMLTLMKSRNILMENKDDC